MRRASESAQLALFDTQTPSIAISPAHVDAIAWSYSRRSVFERCALQYYYQYFGASARSAKAEPLKEELRLLKGLSNRFERAGAILHLAIAWYLRAAQRGEEPSVERLLGWARRLFTVDRDYSRADPEGRHPDLGSKFPPVLLREYHYRHPDSDRLMDEAEKRLVDALSTFATDERMSDFRRAGATLGALIEHPMRLQSDLLPCRVDGKIDLAYKLQTSVEVIDWKLGMGDGGGDDSLQLGAYALWAAEHFECEPSSLHVYKVHLGSAEVVAFSADAALLRLTRARIGQDIERMNAMQVYGQKGVSDAFTPCGQPAVCNGCAFQRVCPGGKQFIDA